MFASSHAGSAEIHLNALLNIAQDRYEQVKDVLYSCIKPKSGGSDDDEETKRKALPLLLALQEAAFRSLGQAWPSTYQTQGEARIQ